MSTQIDRPAQYADKGKVPKSRASSGSNVQTGVVTTNNPPSNTKIQKAPIVISQDTMDDLTEIDMGKVNRRVAKQAERYGEAKRKARAATPVAKISQFLDDGFTGKGVDRLANTISDVLPIVGQDLWNAPGNVVKLWNNADLVAENAKKRFGQWMLERGNELTGKKK